MFEQDQIILVESENTALYYRILDMEKGIKDRILLSFCTRVEGVGDEHKDLRPSQDYLARRDWVINTNTAISSWDLRGGVED